MTVRIPLTCEKRQGPGNHYDAPYVTGRVKVKGQTWMQTFLVDTGASTTNLNGTKLDGLEQVWDEKKVGWVDGVGRWPACVFEDCELVLELAGEGNLTLRLPKVFVFAPYLHLIEGRQEAALAPSPQFPGSKRIARGDFKPCKTPNLLGRDVFRANLLSLAWDPLGNSHIEVHKVG